MFARRVHWEIFLPTADSRHFDIPETMHAAVYRGQSMVKVEEIPTPAIGPGEILIRVEACGICHTDLKKIEHNLLAPPRVYGHETAGVVAAAGSGVTRFRPGDRVVAFHHIPCRNCFYCQRKLYAQCPVYKKVGITAGFEPAGGGFAQYVRVMDWIVERGVEKIPEGVSFERATLVEPLNTCLKAVVQCDPQPEDVRGGDGPGADRPDVHHAGAAHRARAWRPPTPSPARLELAGAAARNCAWDPRTVDVAAEVQAAYRGARRGPGDRGGLRAGHRASRRWPARARARAFCCLRRLPPPSGSKPPARILCVGERTLFGCYSASVDLQAESAHLVFGG